MSRVNVFGMACNVHYRERDKRKHTSSDPERRVIVVCIGERLGLADHMRAQCEHDDAADDGEDWSYNSKATRMDWAQTLTEGREAEDLQPEHLGREQAGLRSAGRAILGDLRSASAISVRELIIRVVRP